MGATPHTTKSSVAAISIFASGGMAAAKFVVGIAIGSVWNYALSSRFVWGRF